jgi:hypothetical protein
MRIPTRDVIAIIQMDCHSFGHCAQRRIDSTAHWDHSVIGVITPNVCAQYAEQVVLLSMS